MNCEQVFDVLTRGPFPTGGSIDEAVEAHLARCPGCRRLAFALQPAQELFEEAVGPQEGQDLPAYSGNLYGSKRERNSAARRPGRTSLRPLRRPRPRKNATIGWPWLNLGRFSLAIALGMSLGVVLKSSLAPLLGSAVERQAKPSASGGTLLAAAGLNEWHDSGLADRLGLRPACRPMPPRNISTFDGEQMPELSALAQSSVEWGSQQCCTQCHVAGREQHRSDAEVVKIVQSCRYCHSH